MRTLAIALLCLSLCRTALAEPLDVMRVTLSPSSVLADLGPSAAASAVASARAPQLSDLRLSIRSSAVASAGAPLQQLSDLRLSIRSLAVASAVAPLQQLSDLRLSIRSSRRTAGFVLLGFGILSVAVGGATAAIGHKQHALLAAGITTASFGAVNAALAPGLMDLSGSDEQRILADRARDPREFAAIRESELIAHLHSGQFFAVNVGLDVFYIATGALLCAIAAVRDQPDRWELGAGAAAIAQGVWLLGFDIINWVNSNNRSTAVRALREF